MNLLLTLTARCNASCAHCSESFGPYRTEALRKDEICRLMSEAATIDDGRPLQFDLTGGEPFLDFELLTEVVAFGAQLGGSVSCVTNAYWARTSEIALSRLATLQQAGLDLLAVSVSRFHQQFVPVQRVQFVLAAAAELAIDVELKGAVTRADLAAGGTLQEWQRTLDADLINIFPVLPKLRDGACLPEEEYCRQAGLPLHRCPGAAVRIDHDGVATSCCAPGANDPFLAIGNARYMHLREIQQNFSRGARQQILREIGPIHFARGAIAAGLGDRLRDAYAGPCDLCLHVRSDPQLLSVAVEMSRVAELLIPQAASEGAASCTE